MFWRAEAARCRANAEAAIALSKFADQMCLKAMGLALVSAPDHPSKRAKIAKTEEEPGSDPKGKGKAWADAMDEDEVIVIAEGADGSGDEWDGIA